MPVHRFGLAAKLVTLLVGLNVLALGIMGMLTYFDARDRLTTAGRAALVRSVASHVSDVEAWGERLVSDLDLLARGPVAVAAIRGFRRGLADMDPGDTSGVKSALYQRADDKYRAEFDGTVKRGGFIGITLLDAEGTVLFATSAVDISARARDALPEAVLRAAQRVLKGEGPMITDFLPQDGGRTAHVVMAVPGRGEVVAGLLIGAIDSHEVATLLNRTDHTVEGQASYLVGADGALRTSRAGLSPDWRITSDDARSGAAYGQSGDIVTDGPSPVMAAFAPVEVLGQTWGLVTEQPQASSVAVVTALGHSTLVRALLLSALAACLVYLVARRLVVRISRLGAVLDRLGDGQLDTPVPSGHGRDELSQMARTTESLRARLRQNRETEVDDRRKSAALATTSAALMMTDTDFNIIYVNSSVVALMSRRQADFATVDAEFNAEKLVGRNMDRFHKMPDRIRALVANPENLPLKTDIYVGNAAVQLHVDAIRNDSAVVIGMVLEWIDVTDQRRDQATLEAIETSMVKCELSFEGVVSRANDQLRALLPEGSQQPDITNVLNADTLSDILRAVARGEQCSGTFRMRAVTGEVFLDGGFYPIRDMRGRPAAAVFIGTDVTESYAAARAADETQRRLLNEQQQVVDSLRIGLGAIAAGDLCLRLNNRLPAENDQLRTDFNRSTDHLRNAVLSVSRETTAMQHDVSEIVTASNDLAKRTEQQAMTLQETAASLDELTQNVSSTAARTVQARTLSEEARERAGSSAGVVDAAEHAMSEIAASSREVVEVISVIDDIAFQTNLLALNAGVEAARAGEAGRGFAVVATEVRALAQRCANAAAEIGQLISRSEEHVEHGVDLVGQAGTTLRDIVDSFSEISAFIGEIALSGDEQSRALTQINGAINQIDHNTRHNAAMFEETVSAAHALAQRTLKLSAAIGQFAVDDGADKAMQVERSRLTEVTCTDPVEIATDGPFVAASDSVVFTGKRTFGRQAV